MGIRKDINYSIKYDAYANENNQSVLDFKEVNQAITFSLTILNYSKFSLL